MEPNTSQTPQAELAKKIARIDALRSENAAPEFGGFVRRLLAEQQQTSPVEQTLLDSIFKGF